MSNQFRRVIIGLAIAGVVILVVRVIFPPNLIPIPSDVVGLIERSSQ